MTTKSSNTCLQKMINHQNTLPCGKKVGMNYSPKQIKLHQKLCKTCKEQFREEDAVPVPNFTTGTVQNKNKSIEKFFTSISDLRPCERC